MLFVIALDTCRNIIENAYFGLFFGSQYGLFPPAIAGVLGKPGLLIIPKLVNVAAGCFVIGVLLMRWLPRAVRERGHSERLSAGLEKLATMDGLTCLFNRRHFETLARIEWGRFQVYGRPLSLLVLDVDEFKRINDRFGHDAGDLVLKTIADDCNSVRREHGYRRLSAVRNLSLLPETSEAAAEIVAERLRKSIQEHSRAFPGEQPQISVSTSEWLGRRSAWLSFEALLKRADEALYEAKRNGRNQVIASPRQVLEKYQSAAE